MFLFGQMMRRKETFFTASLAMDAVSDMHNEPYPEVKMSANTSIPDMQYSRFSVY